MLISLTTNIDLIYTANTMYRAIYVGDTKIWARNAIDLNNFLKYNNQNISIKFKNPPSGDINAPYDQAYFLNISGGFVNGPSQLYTYVYDKFQGYNSANIATSFLTTTITGVFDQNYVSPGYIDYTTIVDNTALYDQAYLLNISGGFVNGLDQTYVPVYDKFSGYNSANIATSFLTTIITGVFDQNYISGAFIDYTTTVDNTALYDQAYLLNISGGFVDGPSQLYTYVYDKFSGYNSANIATSFLNTIITGVFDQNYVSPGYIDYTTIVDNTALYDQYYLLDITNGFVDGNDLPQVYYFDSYQHYDNINIAISFLGMDYIYDQFYVYTVTNMAANFN